MNVKNLVNRFLGWDLPKDFAPDAGISFKPTKLSGQPGGWPVGTNLLTAEQAKQMFEHVLQADIDMDFGMALDALKAGKKVCRAGWNGKGMWLQLVVPHSNRPPQAPTAMVLSLPDDVDTLPWIGMKTADDKFVPWLASQTDMLSEDWMVVP
ncbi:DUF2829 domain-containing protein [Propionivibrio sp.]|uniref:DUF2829 domain-containing protein n=1 Tax=Propionivibrio sp. TaxID=2212460 RepID=UPI0039E70F78